ncbi:hypothetical protein [uncultured Nostoc sp.]|uniref:hypothetical protein n=1 Tax=uncultured Nostoc sp. TaxID=340711 RepID=UPI0035CBE007
MPPVAILKSIVDTRTYCDRSCSKTAIAFQQASLNYFTTIQTKRSKAIPEHLFYYVKFV